MNTVTDTIATNGVLRYRDTRVSFTQMITPEEAKSMLETMKYLHQRPLRPAKVRTYADEMRSGAFCELTQIYIAIYRGRHVILDGQHRLNAVVISDVPVLFSIVEKDVESEEEMARIYSKIDIGTRRTPADIYGAYDLGKEFDLTPTAVRRLGSTVNFMNTGCVAVGKQTNYDDQISGVSIDLVNDLSRRLTASGKSNRPTMRTGRDGRTINTSNIGKKKKSPAPKPAAPKPAPEDEEPLTEYEEQIAAQYQQNGVSAPISEPAGVGEARLTAMADALVVELNYGDLRRLMELLTERIAVDV